MVYFIGILELYSRPCSILGHIIFTVSLSYSFFVNLALSLPGYLCMVKVVYIFTSLEKKSP